jgi:hypothetical protein
MIGFVLFWTAVCYFALFIYISVLCSSFTNQHINLLETKGVENEL